MTAPDYEAGRAELDKLAAWWEAEGKKTRNEATTRLHLINEFLIEVLRWPKGQVEAEESHGGLFADYVLGRPATRLIVEAKREGVYFELPVGVGPGVIALRTLLESSQEIEAAIRQALGYCHERGVPLAAVSNGPQLIAFLASRQDGVPPLQGRALVFDSFAAMQSGFNLLWNNLSREGIEGLTIHGTLGDSAVSTPPAKLSARIPDYPGYWGRNRIQTGLKILGDLVLQDIVTAPELEDDFLRQCYSTSDTLSEYAMVSREILEARYSALTSVESEASTAPATGGKGVSKELTTDVLAASLGRRPLILLGDVGVGKSMFIRHFIRIDAKDVMANSILLYINFGGEPALADDLNDYVMERFVVQLREEGIDVEADKFVRNVYKAELRSFETGVQGRLKKADPAAFEVKEIELLERKVAARDRHLQASLRHASRTLKRQIVVFLDNIDQRDFDFQEKVFLIGQSLADTWPATVFLSLRPDTFYRSRNIGSLTAYQPRVFTISPPDTASVIDKRLSFCSALVSEPAERERIMPEALDKQAETLATYLSIIQKSFRRSRDLVELVENLSGGNVRAALGFLNTFVGSGHVDTKKILDAAAAGGYTVAHHEFLRAIMYGDYRYYDPAASPIANLFEISSRDGREHFLLPILLAHIERSGEVGRREGFVEVEELLELTQALGFLPSQTEFALRHAVDKRLIQLNPSRNDEAVRRYRITTVGAYTYKRLLTRFVYIDAMVVDTPIVDDEAAADIVDSVDIRSRLSRGEHFLDYLDGQWEPLADKDVPFSWPEVSAELAANIKMIRGRLRPLQTARAPATTD
jgi:hypothetical protein